MKRFHPLLAASLILGLGAAGTADAKPYGTPFRVNVATAGQQNAVAVTAGVNGDVAVIFNDVARGAQYLRRYDGAGRPLYRGNRLLGTGDSIVDAALDGAGNLLVLRRGPDGEGEGVFLAAYDASGSVVLPEFQVNDAAAGEQRPFALAVNADGRFAVLWGSRMDSAPVLLVKSYAADGTAATAETVVADYSYGGIHGGDLAMDSAGRVLVAWQYEATPDDSDVYARRFGIRGQPVTSPFRVNTSTTGIQKSPQVATNASGSLAVVWLSYAQEGSDEWGVYGQRFTATAARAGAEFKVNTSATGDSMPAIAMASSGKFVVTWDGLGGTADTGETLAREFTASGAPRAAPFLVNGAATGLNTGGRIGIDGADNYTIAWTARYTATGDIDVQARRYTPPGKSFLALENGGSTGELSGAAGSWRYFKAVVPKGQSAFTVSLSGSGDADLYVRYGVLPTLAAWDAQAAGDGSGEQVAIASPAEGAWYVGVYGKGDYSAVQLNAAADPSASCTGAQEYLCFSQDGGATEVFHDQPVPGSPGSYNPHVFGRTVASSRFTAIGAQYDLYRGLLINVAGMGPGTYLLGGTVGNTAVFMGPEDVVTYSYAPGYASATVTIDTYGAVGEYITGSFDVTLCAFRATEPTSVCADPARNTRLTGTFSVIREGDV